MLVPAYTSELRGFGLSVLHRIDAVLQIFVVSVRRVLLRGVIAQVFPVGLRPPCVLGLVPADALELRGAPSCTLSWFRNNAILEVLAVRERRTFLRGVKAQVYPLASRRPLAAALVPDDTREPRGASVSSSVRRRLASTASLEILAVRARRSFLSGVIAQVLLALGLGFRV
jgi:hypothetical protein